MKEYNTKGFGYKYELNRFGNFVLAGSKYSIAKNKPYCAKILGTCKKYGFKRIFISKKSDDMVKFSLEDAEGYLLEVKDSESKFFAIIENSKIMVLTTEEASQMLNAKQRPKPSQAFPEYAIVIADKPLRQLEIISEIENSSKATALWRAIESKYEEVMKSGKRKSKD